MNIRFLILAFILIVVSIFYKDFVLFNKLPIPADTIVGLYYPYRDLYSKDYPRGIPYKNFMVTDPVRQQYPWKKLSIDILKQGQLPLWNPYSFTGQPLLANFQSGVFYPLNIVFLILSFPYAWSIFIILQSILALLFSFIYLNNLKLDKKASVFGALAFAFGGFSISWLEWGNVIHTALWLPLILFAIDKTIFNIQNPKIISEQSRIKWPFILLLSYLCSFLAGHLQVFFYISIFSAIYTLAKIYHHKQKSKTIKVMGAVFSSFVIISSLVWVPTLQFILNSSRSFDQNWNSAVGWFLPYQNLIQILIPDFFGNPSTLNYWGVFNYGEFISYMGIGAVIFFIFSVFRKDKKTLFFMGALIVAVLFALPTIFAKIPFKLSIPLVESAQPTRLVFIIDFCISVLAALGLDHFLKTDKKRNMFIPLLLISLIFISIWIFILFFANNISLDNRLVSKQNLILPTLTFVVNLVVLIIFLVKPKNKLHEKILFVVPFFIIGILFFDLTRFGWKYLPFTDQKYLYPSTKVIEFLDKNIKLNRVMSTDSRILPPNFSIMHKIQSVDGYDPLYEERYAELIAVLQRGEPNINPPFGFNRIITPQNFNSRLIDLLGVKYVLSFDEITVDKFKLVFKDGSIRVYENKNVLPKVFFVANVHLAKNKQDAINLLFNFRNDLRTNAIVEEASGVKKQWDWYVNNAKIVDYAENKVEIKAKLKGEGFLVLTDAFYPTWKATVDGKLTKIYLTDYNFRGIIVPKGNHKVIFYNTLF